MLSVLQKLISPKARQRASAPAVRKSGPAPKPVLRATHNGAALVARDVQDVDMGRISSREEIPKFKDVLTKAGAAYQLGEKNYSEIVALKTGDKEVCLLVSPNQVRGALLKALKEKLAGDGFMLTVMRADPGLISGIYSGQMLAGGRETDVIIVRQIDELISAAVKVGASDFHIEKRNSQARVLFRRHGRLVPQTEWSGDYTLTFARALHTLADADSKQSTFQESESQSMSVSRVLSNNVRVKLRVQTLRAYPDGGFDIIARILIEGGTSNVKPLDLLGYAQSHIEMFNYMLSKPSGVIVFAGTTGSGKTTSLQTMMSIIRRRNPGWKLIAVEDPPEYVMVGTTQIPVMRSSKATGNPFAKTMRDAMRSDPDVIMVGEVRDHESGECLTSMVQSGHIALTTIHASGAIDIAPRIANNGVPLSTFAADGFVSGLIYQRLVPVLCAHCREDYDPSMSLGDDVDAHIHDRIAESTKPGDTLFVAGKGCSYCDNLGVAGRTVCAEIIIPDSRFLEIVEGGKTAEARRYWRSTREELVGVDDPRVERSMVGMTALEHAILKMRAGIVSPIDVEAELGLLSGYHSTVAKVASVINLEETA